jgi:hypothetical protein
MAVPARRAQRRYPCDLPVDILSFAGELRVAQGRFSDLSIAGAMLVCADALDRGITYFFRLSWKEAPLKLPGRVVWAAPRDSQKPGVRRYGIQLNLTRDQEWRLRAMVESLRLAAPQPARKVLHDYWKPRAQD